MNSNLEFLFAGIFLFGIFLAVTTYFEKQKTKSRAVAGIYPASFATRHQQMLDEVEARKSEEQRYQERIQAAFAEARAADAILVSVVEYADIESDMYRTRNPHVKTMLTRITPIMTKDLAELIRDYEIKSFADSHDSSALAEICIAARAIKWRIEEVPEQYAPPNLKDKDRIIHPEVSAYSHLYQPLIGAARALLGYDDQYIKDEAEKLEKEDFYD